MRKFWRSADIADMIESPPLPFDNKLNKIVSLASSAIGAAIYHTPSCRRMKAMAMLKAAFVNNMEGNVIAISDMVLVGVYAFFDSVAEYDQDTAVDKSKMAQIWDVMAKLPIVHDCVTEYARNKQRAEKKEEKKKEKEKEKEDKKEEKEKPKRQLGVRCVRLTYVARPTHVRLQNHHPQLEVPVPLQKLP